MRKRVTALKPGDRIKFFGTVVSVEKRICPGSPGEFDDAEYWVITGSGKVFAPGKGSVQAQYVTYDATETFNVV